MANHNRNASAVKTGKLEFGAYGVLLLLALVFPVIVFFVVPLMIVDLAAPAITQNYFTS